MPWRQVLYQKALIAYLDSLEDRCKVRTRKSLLKELRIISEFLKRDFSKRQQNILIFVYTLSFPYAKESAFIPNMQDFELCGVSKTKIKEEIDKLVKMNVLDWDKPNNTFTIKDPDMWEVPHHSSYSEYKARELFLANLKHADIELDEIIKRLEQ
ncbi:replication protein [Pseudobacillus badius]|uniref:replication protein n=1 Tax=Bacillus badius TaxID=1455 RepID=UPI0007B3B7EC|nr:replication protein [Bacillus badius]KZR59143.1 hypothetical protein A3781_01155 [Bacillus badius]